MEVVIVAIPDVRQYRSGKFLHEQLLAKECHSKNLQQLLSLDILGHETARDPDFHRFNNLPEEEGEKIYRYRYYT